MEEGRDFSVSYSNNIEPGTATITITGIGGYEGVIEKTFKIEGEISPDVIDISTLESKVSMKEKFEYTGNNVEPKVIIEGLEEGRDFSVSYKDNVEIGQATVIITGKGKYKGNIIKTFNITKLDISKITIKMPSRFEYTGKKVTTYPYVEGLRINRDYTVNFENSVEPGTGTVTITGIGKYKGVVKKSFIIYRNLSKMEVQLSETSYLYDGEKKEPKVTIEGLEEGKDFSVSYKNNIEVGTATVTIKGITDYCCGTTTKTFTISEQNKSTQYLDSEINENDISNLDLQLQASNFDTENKPTLKIQGLEEGVDYTLTYNEDKNSKSLNIKGIDNYKGEKVIEVSKDTKIAIEQDGVQYNILSNGEAEVYKFKESGVIANIKEEIKGFKVTKINKNAFINCKKLLQIEIPESISKIDKSTFYEGINITIIGKTDSYVINYANENEINFR